MSPPRQPQIDISSSTIRLDPSTHPRRSIAAPRFARGDRFELDLDPTLLIADIFREAARGRILILLGTIPRNLDPATGIVIRCGETGRTLSVSMVNAGQVRAPHWLIVEADAAVTWLEIEIGGQLAIRPVQPNLSPRLAGRRVLFTICRDEPLERIVDWAWWHVERHRFDAVLYYDNASRGVTRQEIAAALSSIPGLETVIAVDWPHVAWPIVNERPWYANEAWGQIGGLWHALQRCLREADMVFYADVDELLFAPGDASLDRISENNAWTALRFQSYDVVSTSVLPETVRHRDLHLVSQHPTLTRAKWLGRPRRIGPNVHASQHDPGGRGMLDVDPEEFRIAHFLPLTSGWNGREHRRAPALAPANQAFPGTSSELRRQLDDVFGRWMWSPPPPQPIHPDDAAWEAWTAIEHDPASALPLIDAALAVEPHQPALAAARRTILNALPEDFQT